MHSFSKQTTYKVLETLEDKNSIMDKTQSMSSKSLQANATTKSTKIKTKCFPFGLAFTRLQMTQRHELEHQTTVGFTSGRKVRKGKQQA